MVILTFLQAKRVQKINEIKNKYGYKYANGDFKLDSMGKILKTALTSMFAGINCGIAGIAPGMVLGPLFLSYNMIP